MAFTLISIGRLDEANCSVNFRKGMCTIKMLKVTPWLLFHVQMAYIV
jgi:hypothetical protein